MPWGVKVSLVETNQVDLDKDMQRAIARQAEAERERRAKVIHAEGEAQASGEAGRGGKHDECIPCGHPSTVPSDVDGGWGGEQLDGDRPNPRRLTHSLPAKKGKGIA